MTRNVPSAFAAAASAPRRALFAIGALAAGTAAVLMLLSGNVNVDLDVAHPSSTTAPRRLGGSGESVVNVEATQKKPASRRTAAAISENHGSRLKKSMCHFGRHRPRDEGTRPMIYTYHDHSAHTPLDREVIAEWCAAWRDAGWQPVILSLKDARSTRENDDLLKEVVTSSYPWTRGRILRYWAMASVEGGGWLADFDVYPLPGADLLLAGGGIGRALPNSGTFTTYLVTMPVLVSASQSEYERMARTFAEHARSYHARTGRNDWSDYVAAHGIMKRHDDAVASARAEANRLGIEAAAAADLPPPPFIRAVKIIKGQDLMSMLSSSSSSAPPSSPSLCDDIQKSGTAAVLFAKYSVEVARESGRIGPEGERHHVAREWIDKWEATCGGGVGGGGTVDGVKISTLPVAKKDVA